MYNDSSVEIIVSDNNKDITSCLEHPVYGDLLIDYSSLVNFRLSDKFEEIWNENDNIDFGSAFNEIIKEYNKRMLACGSDSVGSWSNMIVEMKNKQDLTVESFGYVLFDMNDDGVDELFWTRSDNSILAVFTCFNNNIVMLDVFWSDYKAIVTEQGYLYTLAYDGANNQVYEIKKLSEGAKFEQVKQWAVEYCDDYSVMYYEYVNSKKIEISKSEFEGFVADNIFEHSDVWMGLEIHYLSSENFNS